MAWNAPTDGDSVDEYRVDISYDAGIWHNVIGGENSTDMLTKSMAESNCDADDNRDSCYTVGDLMPGMTYHFRVFAMNQFGTSPISVDETIGTGATLPVDPPDTVTGLTATTYFTDKIVLDWQEPVDNGGADVVWYCIAVAASPSGAFDDLARDTTVKCLEATEAITAAVADDEGVYTSPVPITSLVTAEVDVPQTIVVAATDEDDNPVTRYEHLGLRTPSILALRYRAYAVTDDNGETAGGRRVSLAASNTATGRTVAPPDTAPTQARAPEAPMNLRVVAYGTNRVDASPATLDDTTDDTLSSPMLNFYWNTPGNFPKVGERNWGVQVARAVSDGEGGSTWQDVSGTAQDVNAAPLADPDNAVAQFEATLGGANPITLIGDSSDSGYFRVRYVNPGPDGTTGTLDIPSTDDIVGAPTYIRLQTPLDGNDHIDGTIANSTLPIITKAGVNGNDVNVNPSGLRFVRNQTDAKRRIDLRWMRDANSNSVEARKQPTGYVIDRSADGGVTWQSLYRATIPENLGVGTTYTDANRTDHEVAPGTRYTYRVFPVGITPRTYYQDDFGLPVQIHASAEEATVPARVEGLRVTPNGQTKLDLEWRPVPAASNGGHPIKGYLVQVAKDIGKDGMLDPDAMWDNVGLNADETPANADDLITVGKDIFKFTYTGSAAQRAPLSAQLLVGGSERWFRVIAITNENDGDDATGGNQVDITNGSVELANPSPSEDLPTEEDTQIALPKRGMTDTLGDPDADEDPSPPEKPADLTAEAASDTNALGDGNRGVFLTWNEVKGANTETVSYKIERMRMNTGVDALNDTMWQFIGRATGDTSFADRLPLRQDEETRMYRVGSEAISILGVVFVDDPGVMYALHPPMHMPSMPQMVEATADSATEVTVSWAVPADSGGSAITGFMVRWKQSDATSYAAANMATAAPTASSHMVTGLMAGTSYTFQVRATNAEGDSYWSMYAMAMTDAAVTELMAPAITMTTIDDADPGALDVMVTWTAGANADGQLVMLFTGDFAGDPVVATKSATDTMHTFTGVANGDYVVVVVSYTNDVNFQFDFTSVSVAGGS